MPLLEYPANRDNLMRLADGIKKLLSMSLGHGTFQKPHDLFYMDMEIPRPRSPVGDKQGNSQHFEKKN